MRGRESAVRWQSQAVLLLLVPFPAVWVMLAAGKAWGSGYSGPWGAAAAERTVGAAVDVVPLALDAGCLHAAVVRVEHGDERHRHACPGGRVRENESLDDAAVRWLGPTLAAARAPTFRIWTEGLEPAATVLGDGPLCLLVTDRPDGGQGLLPTTTHRPPTACRHGRAASANSGANRCTHRYTVTWSTAMPRSASSSSTSR